MPKKRIGQSVGKAPTKAVNIALTGSKYASGGQKVKRKKGGVIRKPKATIRYKRGK